MGVSVRVAIRGCQLGEHSVPQGLCGVRHPKRQTFALDALLLNRVAVHAHLCRPRPVLRAPEHFGRIGLPPFEVTAKCLQILVHQTAVVMSRAVRPQRFLISSIAW